MPVRAAESPFSVPGCTAGNDAGSVALSTYFPASGWAPAWESITITSWLFSLTASTTFLTAPFDLPRVTLS